MRVSKIVFILILVVADGFAQQVDSIRDWVRFESPAHDFSVSLPASGLLVDNEDGAYRLHFLSGATSIRVDMTLKSRAKEDFRAASKLEGEKKYKFAESGDFLIGQFIGEDKKENLETIW